MDLSQLREQIARYFDLEELRTLCFDLKVDYDLLRGEGKAAKARELVLLMEREERLAELVKQCARRRPNVTWEAAPPARPQPTAQESSALKMARRALAILEEQAAAYTALTIPVHLKIELEEKRRQVQDLEKRLNGF
jgi:hypothetical protein